MAALKLPQTAQEALPFAILFGTMLAFWRLTRSNELVVARAAGVSVWQFLTPAVLVALLVGVVAVTVFNPIASSVEATYEKLDSRDPAAGVGPAVAVDRPGCGCGRATRPAIRSSSMATRLGPQDLTLDGVTLYFFDDQTRFTSRVEAQSARLEKGEWVIEDGVRWLPDQSTAAVRRAAPADPADPTQDRGELRLARYDVVLGAARLYHAARSSRAFRRSAIACISTCCWRARSCCARWCWSRRPSACGCSGAAARG